MNPRKNIITKHDTVYISGPMRHQPFLNFPMFFAVEKYLRETFDCKVLNPAKNEVGLSLKQYMIIDKAMVTASTIILLLPNWEKSEGANDECDLAKELGLTILELEDIKYENER